MSKKENSYQKDLKKKLEKIFEGCIILKNDPELNPSGIPDLTIFYKNKWATLETKRNPNSSKRPNQPYYVNLMNEMSFSRFINPENEEEVINDLSRAFGIKR